MGLDIATKAVTASPWGAVAKEGMGLLGGIIGMVGQRQRENRAMQNQEKLMGIQQQNQMTLNQQGKDLALQQWKDTNYGPQVEEMKKAGLNPALLYGMSGGGGATTGGAQGGSAASGNAPAPQQMPMDMASMMQMSLIGAQKALMEAQAKKTNVEADKLAGADTENTQANTALTNMQTENQRLHNTLLDMSLDDSIQTIKANRDKAIAEARTKTTEADVYGKTQKEQIDQIKLNAALTAVKIASEKQGIKLSKAQINNMAEQINIGKYNMKFQGTDKVAGKAIEEVVEGGKSLWDKVMFILNGD
jgi:hypothetical protein